MDRTTRAVIIALALIEAAVFIIFIHRSVV
jgi:hypothetical protein